MLRLLGALSQSWKGAALVATVIGVGFVAGLTLGGYWKMPERLLLLEAHQTVADSVSRDLAQQVRALRGLIRSQLCLTVSDRKKTPWEDCLIGDYKP